MSVRSAETLVELRCPVGPRALLAKLVQSGEKESYTSDNLMELSCRDCCKQLRKTNPNVKRVLHRFNIFGELVESIVQDDSE